MITEEAQTTEEIQIEETSFIDNKVTGTVVRQAAMKVKGVADVVAGDGGNFIKNISGMIGGSRDRGVAVVSGTKGAIVDLNLIVMYGDSIPEIIDKVRTEVRRDVQKICGMDAKAVNVKVTDIRFDETHHMRATQVN